MLFASQAECLEADDSLRPRNCHSPAAINAVTLAPLEGQSGGEPVAISGYRHAQDKLTTSEDVIGAARLQHDERLGVEFVVGAAYSSSGVQFCLSRSLSGFDFIDKVERVCPRRAFQRVLPTHLRAASAGVHTAPAAVTGLAEVEKEPSTAWAFFNPSPVA